MSEQLRPVDPVTIVTIDGQEHKLLLTTGTLLRTKRAFGVSSAQALFAGHDANNIYDIDREEVAIRLIYEALEKSDRAAIDFDSFTDLIPLDPNWITDVMGRLFKEHGAQKQDPPTPAPEAETTK